MIRSILALIALATPIAATAQTSINGRQVQVDGVRLDTALNAKAPLASPALTGTPTAPTPANTVATTQLATTAFVSTLTRKGVTINTADAASSLTVTANKRVVVLAGTLTANRVFALSATGAVAGDEMLLLGGNGVTAFNYSVRNLTSSGTVLVTLVDKKWAYLVFEGTNWFLVASGTASTTP